MSYNNKELFSSGMADYVFSLNEKQLSDFEKYAELLVETNKVMNLTAITDSDGIAIKHFLDSAMLLKYFTPKEGATIIDVGTGAGFPTIPCKIIRPDLNLTLLDSLNKRVKFLDNVCETLGFDHYNTVHSRAEEGSRRPAHRDKYDIATARAVANMAVLTEYCLPYVKVGGVFIALKGPNLKEELKESEKSIKAMGGKIEQVIEYTLPDNQHRTIVIIKKISQTPTKYPRISAKIGKEPIR